MAAKPERLAAFDAVYKATPVPNKVLAAALDWTEGFVTRTAKARGLTKAPSSPADLNRRVRRHLERRLTALEADETSGRKLTQTAERVRGDQLLKIYNAINANARDAGNDASTQERIDTDAELTDVLRQVDRRITELAHQYASELVAPQHTAETGAAGAGVLPADGAAEAA